MSSVKALLFIYWLSLSQVHSINASSELMIHNSTDVGTSRRLDTGKFTGSFTLVKAQAENTATDASINLGTYLSVTTIDLKLLSTIPSLSLNVGFTGTFSKVRFLFNDGINNVVKNEASPPYALQGNNGNNYISVPYLKIIGTKSITVKGFSSTNAILDTISLQLTMIDTSAGPTTPVKSPTIAPSASPVATPAPVPAPVTAPVAVPAPTASMDDPLKNGKWIVTNTTGSWDARHEACFVMAGRKAVLIGGRGIRRVNIYDPVTKIWSTGAAPPEKIVLNHMQCVYTGGKIWIVAAWTGSYPEEQNTDYIYIYDVIGNSWSTRDAMPEARRRGSSAVVAVGDKIYVVFGNKGGHETANHSTAYTYLDEYDTLSDTWTPLPDGSLARDHVGGALVKGNKICIGGGRDGGTKGWPLTLPAECYDIATRTWSVGANIPDPAGGASYGTSCDDRLLVAGGEIWGSNRRAIRSFDAFDGKEWVQLPLMNQGRHGSGLAVDCVCNAIYIASGNGKAGGGMELLQVETFYPGGVEIPCNA